MLSWLSSAKKAVVAGIGSLLTVLTFVNAIPFVPANIHTTVGVVIAVLTTALTYLVPNKTAVKTGP
jgi:hypothetical protein